LRGLRLLILGDVIWGTSAYSKVVWHTARLLRGLGCQVAHLPTGRALKRGPISYMGTTVYPSGEDPWGQDVVERHYYNFSADLVFTVKDPWVFSFLPSMPLDWAPLCPIDHSPVSASITSKLHTAFRAIVPSRFAQRELKEAGIDSTYIPHGVDTATYRPLDKARCKKMWFLDPEHFVVGIVAMNRARKMIPRMLRGFKLFLDRNPDLEAKLFLWTDIRPKSKDPTTAMGLGVADVGVDLLPEMVSLGIGEKVVWPDRELVAQGIPDWIGEDYEAGWDMVKLYNAFDVLLMCTGGEGAGLPLLEAQSCGVPVVATDYAGAPEHVGVGYTVPWSDYVVINTPGTRYALADLDRMAQALSKLANADLERLGRKARRFAERFDWSVVAERYWQAFLDWAEPELRPRISRGGVDSW